LNSIPWILESKALALDKNYYFFNSYYFYDFFDKIDMQKNAKIILTGAAGLVGQNLIVQLKELKTGITLFGLSFLTWIYIVSKNNLSYAFPFALV